MPAEFPDGFFVPQTYDDGESPPGIVADAIDPHTGEYLSITRGFDPTDAAVLNALTIVRGSGSAVSDVGHRFVDLELVDDGADRFISEEARFALKRLRESGQISIEKLEPASQDDWAECHVAYKNLVRGDSLLAPVPIGRLTK